MGEAELRRCILGGNATLLLVVTAVVAAFVYVPPAQKVAESEYLRIGSIVAGFVSLALLLLSVSAFKSHAYQRFVFVFVGLAMTALLIVATTYTSSKAVVVASLIAAAVLTSVAALVGASVDSASSMGPALFGGMFLFLFGLLMSFFLHAHWFEVVVSTFGVALFTGLSVYEANEFIRQRRCRHSCCEEGVFSLFQNFVNLAVNLFNITS